MVLVINCTYTVVNIYLYILKISHESNVHLQRNMNFYGLISLYNLFYNYIIL